MSVHQHEYGGNVYEVTVDVKEVLHMGTKCEITIRDHNGRLVTRDRDAYIIKGETFITFDRMIEAAPNLRVVSATEPDIDAHSGLDI